MATEIKRIEKESVINSLHSKRIGMDSLIERNNYRLTLTEVSKTTLVLVPDRPLPETGVAPGKKISLMANYMSMNTFFTVEIKDKVKESYITTYPDILYRNLERSCARQSFPSGMSLQFASLEEKFILPFPLLEQDDTATPVPGLEKSDYNGVVTHLAEWVKTNADAYKLMLFRDTKISRLDIEKSLLMKTGKTLFLPSTEAGLPETDETPEKRILTTELSKNISISSSELAQFIETRRNEGMRSCVWIPLFFQRYVIGYIQIWVSAADKAPLGIEHIAMLYQYGKSISNALVARGYFSSTSLKNKFFTGNGENISASGILFSYPLSALSPAFTETKEIMLKLNIGTQIISAPSRIIRYYRQLAVDYWGCRFIGMAPEDSRTLAEYLYSKPFEQLQGTSLFGKA